MDSLLLKLRADKLLLSRLSAVVVDDDGGGGRNDLRTSRFGEPFT